MPLYNYSVIDSHNTEQFNNLFGYCSSLKKINFGTLDTSNATSMYDMFRGCESLTEVVLSPNMTVWNTNAVLPDGIWTNASLGMTLVEAELCEEYPSHAAEWAGTWTRPESAKARIDETSIELAEGGSYKLTATVTPEGTTIESDSWRIGNSIVASVEQDGTVTGIKAGITVAIYEAYLDDGTYLRADCEVVVRSDTPTSSTAYAVLADDGDLIFFRSTDEYNNLDYQTVTDINNNEYTGIVFTDVEIGRNNWSGYDVINAYVAPDTTIAPATMRRWFNSCWNLESFDGTGFDTSNVTDMEMMFYSCRNMTSANLAGFDTSYVNSMAGMFAYCNALTNVTVDGWNTSRLSNLCQMFIKEIFGESALDELDDEILVTVNKFFENSLNVSETSRQLYIHRNTLVYRIEKLQRACGLDVRVFEDALTLKLALMVESYIKYMNKES